jgi:hypothetical protein
MSGKIDEKMNKKKDNNNSLYKGTRQDKKKTKTKRGHDERWEKIDS